MSDDPVHMGRCFCGAVELAVTGEPEVMGYCHCISCREWAAAPVNAFTLWQRESRRPLSSGEDDIFFTPEGGESYLKDLPHAEMHRLNSGHFAVEHCLSFIVEKMIAFYERTRAR